LYGVFFGIEAVAYVNVVEQPLCIKWFYKHTQRYIDIWLAKPFYGTGILLCFAPEDPILCFVSDLICYLFFSLNNALNVCGMCHNFLSAFSGVDS
jgi:hypothetical protein